MPLHVDGVFFEGQAGALDFRPLPPPTDDEVGVVLTRIATRVQRLLERRGLDFGEGDLFRADPVVEESPALAGISSVVGLLSTLWVGSGPAQAASIDPFYAGGYGLTDLGSIAGLPTNYGGLVFKAGDANKILIGGAANSAGGRLYEVGVTRGAGGHITGFTGAPVVFGSVGEYNDGGVAYGPGGVLFTSQWPVNKLGQTKPGSTDEDKIIDLAALGVGGSHSAVNFIPSGFSGAGDMRLVTYGGGEWYDTTLTPDGTGTYDVGVTRVDLDPVTAGIQNLPGGPEGFVYIAAGNPLFAANSILVSAYANGTVDSYTVDSYTVDASSNPILSSRKTFVSALSGAEGAAIDPVTGDFLFSTFGGGNHVIVVQGFNVPASVPVPATLMLVVIGVAALGLGRGRRARR